MFPFAVSETEPSELVKVPTMPCNDIPPVDEASSTLAEEAPVLSIVEPAGRERGAADAVKLKSAPAEESPFSVTGNVVDETESLMKTLFAATAVTVMIPIVNGLETLEP